MKTEVYVKRVEALPILVLSLFFILFFFLRTIQIYNEPQISYIFYRLGDSTEYLFFTLYYSFLGYVFFIFGYYSIRYIDNQRGGIESVKVCTISSSKLKVILYIFLFAISIKLFRYVVLGEVQGASRSSFFKYLFFIDWFLPIYALLGVVIAFSKSNKIKIFCILITILTVILSGMKSGLIYPFIVLLSLMYIQGRLRFNVKGCVFVLLICFAFFLLFPVLISVVASIRDMGEVQLYDIKLKVVAVFYAYDIALIKVTEYLAYRLSEIEYVQTMFIKSAELNSYDIGLSHFLVHLLNGFIPSFFVPTDDIFMTRSANALYPIIFFGQSVSTSSSENLTIYGLFLFYFGKYGVILLLPLGMIFSLLVSMMIRQKNSILFLLQFFLFVVMFFLFYQSGSIEHFTVFIKECISVYILLATINLFRLKKNDNSLSH